MCQSGFATLSGESEAEFRRLEMQAAFVRDLTEDVLRRAGLKPRMRGLRSRPSSLRRASPSGIWQSSEAFAREHLTRENAAHIGLSKQQE